jgi:glutamyl-tRNA synthetase
LSPGPARVGAARGPVVGRFAPSPTGDFHLGNARTALLAWLQARSAGGRFLVRMEDLDAGRVRPEFYRSQLQDLRWLGLDWDEGPDVGGPHAPYLQSERQDAYEAALDRLAEMGRLYSCFCTRREIASAASAPHMGDDEGPRYPGTCARSDPTELQRRRGRSAALRFRTPERTVEFDDLLQGHIRFSPAAEVGDFVVRRKDGVAAYQLAVVVDDADMEITHVVRGADLMSSTARQILLYEALGLTPPLWVHVPLLLGPDRERLAKRHDAPSIRQLRERGVDPEYLVGWLAASCGILNEARPAPPAELLGSFSVDRLPREATVLPPLPWV